MDKKIYSIEINGIKENISQVDLLQEKLKELDTKLKDLSKGGVKISIGGGTKKTVDEIDETSNTVASLRKQLSALKKEWANTEIGSDKFDELKKKTLEVNNQLKGLEQNIGVFNRSVGDYTNSFIKAFSQFPQSVQDSIKGLNGFKESASTLREQLKSCKDAMDELAASGKKNSEEYGALKKVYAELADEQETFNAELKHATDNQAAFNDMVGVFSQIANAMTLATAASQLFGASQDDILKGVAKLQQLAAIANSLKELQKAFQNGAIGARIWQSSLSGAEKILKMLGVSARSAATAEGALTTATLTSAKAFDVLKVAIASTGIGLIVVAIGTLIGYLSTLESSSDKAAKSFERIAQSTNTAIDTISTKRELGIISSLDEAMLKLEEYEKKAKKVFGEIDKLIDDQKNNNFFTKMFGGDLSGISDKLGKSFINWSKNIRISINNIEDAEKALKECDEWAKKLNEDGASEEWNESLKQTRETILDIKKGLVDVQKEQKQLNEDIAQMNIDAMKDGYSKSLAQLEENFRKEKQKYGENTEAIAALEKKHQREILELNKEWGRKRLEVERQIASNELASHKNNLEIRLKQLELERANEIQRAKDSQIRVNEQIASINAKYDFKVAEEKKKNLEKIEQYTKQHLLYIARLYLENTTLILEQEQQKIEDFKKMFSSDNAVVPFKVNVKETGVDELEKKINVLSQLYDDFEERSGTRDDLWDVNGYSENFRDFIDVVKTYNDEITKNQIEEYNKLQEAQKEYWRKRLSYETKEHAEWLLGQRKTLQDMKLSEEEYNKQMELLQEESNIIWKNKHDKFNAEKERSAKEINQKISDLYREGYENQINYLNELDIVTRGMLENLPVVNDWQIINYSESIKRYKEVRDIYVTQSNDIEKALIQVQKQFTKGLITTEAYNEIVKQLQKLGIEVNKQIKTLDNTSKDLKSDFASSVNSYVQTGLQSASQLMGTIFDKMNADLQAEMNQLQDANDKLSDMYDKQVDIVQQHVDKINDIEGELGSARGDRRDQLIAAFNEEQRAREREFLKQKQIEKEKERNEKKQQELQKRMAKQQHKQQIAQAIISAAMATANGFATKPFVPVGIAMGSLAAALGAAQVAIISSTKPYRNGGSLPSKFADGGQIQGRSHEQGGVPIKGLSRPVEVEGNEFITNKRTTQMNLPLLEFINSKKHRINLNEIVDFYHSPSKVSVSKRSVFAEGGQLPQMDISSLTNNVSREVYVNDNRPIVVDVREITSTQDHLRKVETLAGL